MACTYIRKQVWAKPTLTRPLRTQEKQEDPKELKDASRKKSMLSMKIRLQLKEINPKNKCLGTAWKEKRVKAAS